MLFPLPERLLASSSIWEAPIFFQDSSQIDLFRETCSVTCCSPPSGTGCSCSQLCPGTLRALLLLRVQPDRPSLRQSSSHGLGPRAPGQGPCLVNLSSTRPGTQRFNEVCWMRG